MITFGKSRSKSSGKTFSLGNLFLCKLPVNILRSSFTFLSTGWVYQNVHVIWTCYKY